MHKGLVIIVDGLGDRPCSALDGATPLEAAATPNLDRLAREGACGLLDPLEPGVPVDTHTGAGALMGLEGQALRELKRGPVEATGAGLVLAPGDVVLRCNFATLLRADQSWEVLDRRAGRITEGTAGLAAALDAMQLDGGIMATFQPATDHRAVLRLAGPNLSAEITDTDPGDAANPGRVLACHARHSGDGSAAATASAVNQFQDEARVRLAEHPINLARVQAGLPPANGILCRGAGRCPQTDSWLRRLGLRVAVVAVERTVLGLARLLGYTPIYHGDLTSYSAGDLESKVAAALTALERNDVVFLHVKAADIFSHDRDPLGKRDFLGRLDAALAPLLGRGLVIAVTADHTTDSERGVHTGDPVPALLSAPGARRDESQTFGELTCARGLLGRIDSSAFHRIFLDQLGVLPCFQSTLWP